MSGCNRILENTVGGSGFEYIAGTTKRTPPANYSFFALQCITDSVIAAYEVEGGSEITGDTFTGVTLTAGTIIYGKFRSITLTSGTMIAYKGM